MNSFLVQNLNPKWRPSAILDFRKPDFWTLGPIGLSSFRHCTKFGAKMLIDAQSMAQNEIQNGGRRHLEFISGGHFKIPPTIYTVVLNYRTKFNANISIHDWILVSSMDHPYEVLALGRISVSNFMLIRCVVLKTGIWIFAYLAWNVYSCPQHFRCGWISTPKRHWSPVERHICAWNHVLWALWAVHNYLYARGKNLFVCLCVCK